MNKLSPYQADILDKILAMRKLTAETGFRTNQSQSRLLGQLNPNDLAAVAQALQKSN